MADQPVPAADTVFMKAFSLVYQTMVQHDAEIGDDWTFGSHAQAVVVALVEAGLLHTDGSGCVGPLTGASE